MAPKWPIGDMRWLFALNGWFSPKNISKSGKAVIQVETYGFRSLISFVGNSDKKAYNIEHWTNDSFSLHRFIDYRSHSHPPSWLFKPLNLR